MAQESWTVYGGTFAVTTGVKMGLSMCLPWLGSLVDFYQAATCFYDGDVWGGAISLVSGVGELYSCGITSAIKNAMKGSAKEAVVQTAKDIAKTAGKEASRNVGQGLAKQLAMGTIEGGKDAAINTAKAIAKSASKEATRKLGQQVGKEIAQGVIPAAVAEVWYEGTKMTLNGLLRQTSLAAVSSGGHQVTKTILEDLFEKLIYEMLKQKPKEVLFEFTKEAAKKGAEEEFKKHSYRLIVNDVVVAGLKGAIRRNQGGDSK